MFPSLFITFRDLSAPIGYRRLDSCLLFLPETAGERLPETMDQAIALSNKPQRGLFSCIFPKSFKELLFGKSQESDDSENAQKSNYGTNT